MHIHTKSTTAPNIIKKKPASYNKKISKVTVTNDTLYTVWDAKTVSKATKHLKKDPILAHIIKTSPTKFKITPATSRYRALIETIIAQQLSGHSARAISQRFKTMYGASTYPKPSDVAETSHSELKKTGLSIRKAECIKEISQMIKDKRVRLDNIAKMSDEQIIETLTQIRGVGRWTAEIFLMFGLGRTDVLPAGDLGLRKGVMKFYDFTKMPSEDTVREMAEKWRPYRTIATWYIWKSQ